MHPQRQSNSLTTTPRNIHASFLLLFCCSFFTNISAQSETLLLKHWKFRNDSSVKFVEAANLNRILRENAVKNDWDLSFRFKPQSIAFHDSVASLKHEIVCEFELSSKQKKASSIELQFQFLQTFADVYLNDKFLGSTNNAFRIWKFRLNKKLLKRKNVIRIEFKPPREEVEELVKKSIPLPADNQSDALKTSPFIRQPQQEFGWDFCVPEIYTGFRVSPQIVFLPKAVIEHVSVFTESIPHGNAKLKVRVKGDTGKRGRMLNLQSENHKLLKLKLPAGEFDTLVNYTIPKARLWWPKGTGRFPEMYTMNAWFSGDDDTTTTRFGVRTIDLIQEPDSIGESFYFKVNNEAVFMEGANVVMPNEAFTSDRVAGLSTKELDYVYHSNMNMLRIWGGGNYLPDAFYTWADTSGILIWQDFMFACTYYPVHDDFLEILKPELEYQIKRLNAHPCLALFCGNNEINVARKNWGWEQTYGYSVPKKRLLDSNYEFLFEQFIKGFVQEHGMYVPYLPSSPVSNWGKTKDLNVGDNHDWSIWHGEYPVDSVKTRIPRFMSEFGFPSFPSSHILEEHYGLKPNYMNLGELVKSYKGLKLLLKYLNDNRLPAGSSEQIIQSSQILQAKVYEDAKISHFNAQPRCMGTLFWQLNEVAPLMSWSVLDLDGNPKVAP